MTPHHSISTWKRSIGPTYRLAAIGTLLLLWAGCSDTASAPPSDSESEPEVSTDETPGSDERESDSDEQQSDSDEQQSDSDEQESDDPPVAECADGVDNDGDGLTDWQYDVGCYAAEDNSEAGLSRAAENGWTTFNLSADSRVVYVSASEGDDDADGLSPRTAVATLERGAALVRDGYPDFLLLKRGDTWRGEDIGPDRVVRRFKSGRDKTHPLVVYSYGESTDRPRLEIDKHLIDHDGNERNYTAVVGLALISYPKIPDDPEFNGTDGGALRLIGDGHDILVEDNYVEYGELIVQNMRDVEIRRNVVYRSYEVGTCAYNDDGSRNPNGNSAIRPSGIFCGSVDGLLIEENLWDENGWNPDVPEACATIYNHDLYLSGNSRVSVRGNLILRASSIGIKVSASEAGDVTDFAIEDNLFAEGEIGISMGGNADTPYRFADTRIANNVFTDIGRSQPTGRDLTWYIDLIDNDGSVIAGNLLVHQPPLSNSYGIQLEGGTNRTVTIESNAMFGMKRRLLSVRNGSAYEAITVRNNTLAGTDDRGCIVSHEGGFSDFTYAGNRYGSTADEQRWFCVDGDEGALVDWLDLSGATGETTAPPPRRTRHATWTPTQRTSAWAPPSTTSLPPPGGSPDTT